jgi:hypothetical protein
MATLVLDMWAYKYQKVLATKDSIAILENIVSLSPML